MNGTVSECHNTTCYIKNADCSANLPDGSPVKLGDDYSLIFNTSAALNTKFCVKCSNVDQALEAMNLEIVVGAAPEPSSSKAWIIVVVAIVIIIAIIVFFYFRNKNKGNNNGDLSSMK